MTLWEFLQTPLARLILAGTVLAILALIAWWFIKGMREEMQDEGPSAGDLLDQFRDLRDQGELSPEEFKKIKTRLGGQLREEVTTRPATGEARTDPKSSPIEQALAASIEAAKRSEAKRSDET
ncbi:MAG TPA: hypothetical protein VGN57_07355 [Pirellulaceae bacterium]|jgi:hypothetical protein|nr:hypothetical protein [Pirellulaceae bacterium]